MTDTPFKGRGYLYVATVTAGVPGKLRWLGDVEEFEPKLSVEEFTDHEWYSGNDLQTYQTTTKTTAEFSATLKSWDPETLALVTRAQVQQVTAGSAVTNEAAPTGLAVGDAVLFKTGYNASAVTITDSTGSPKTLVLGTNYELLRGGAGYRLLDLTTGGPYVQPFKAAYTPGAYQAITMLTAADQEWWLHFSGLNVANPARPFVLADFYRGKFNPAESLPLITADELGKLTATGTLLADTSKTTGGQYGQFGRIVVPAP